MAAITKTILKAKDRQHPVSKLTHQERVVITALLTFQTDDNQPHPSKIDPDRFVLDIR